MASCRASLMAVPDAGLSAVEQDAALVLALTGRLDAAGAGVVWRPAVQAAAQARGRPLVLDLHALTACDMSGATLLLAIEAAHGGLDELRGASERVTALLRRAHDAAPRRAAVVAPQTQSLRDQLRIVAVSCSGGIAFLGEAALAVLALPRRRRMVRGVELARHAEQAGTRSLPLVVLLGYLMGLILAFQSAIPMRRFGADLFVANLVAISLLRELGPLLAAVILSGRTGSAFAAEIGTMKVNEEVDALATMGLDPMTMLVLPRLVAVMLVMPSMTLALELAGLLGMATVMVGFGFPISAVAHQVQSAATVTDLLGGLFKSVVFGAAVAAIGCRAGLATGVGPRAVGLSATAAVVGGILSTILLDGLFALLFYRLGL